MLSIVVAAGVLVAGASFADETGAAGEIDLRARVAILPMVVNSIGEQGYLRSGLSDMLASRLGRNPGVAVVIVDGEAQATTDPLEAARAGVEHGAQFVVFGSFTQFGEGASLDVQCVEARSYQEGESPGARRVFIQSGTVGEIIPKLDETAEKIGRFVSGGASTQTAAAAVGAAPTEPGPRGRAAAAESDVADLRRRLEAIEAYLFGAKTDGAPSAQDLPDASQDFGPR